MAAGTGMGTGMGEAAVGEDRHFGEAGVAPGIGASGTAAKYGIAQIRWSFFHRSGAENAG